MVISVAPAQVSLMASGRPAQRHHADGRLRGHSEEVDMQGVTRSSGMRIALPMAAVIAILGALLPATAFGYTAPDPCGNDPYGGMQHVGDLVSNCNFETNLFGWNSAGDPGTVLSTTTATAHSGYQAAQLTRLAPGNATLNDTGWGNVFRGNRFGVWVYGTAWVAGPPGRTVKLRFREYENDVLIGSAYTSYVLPDAGWHQVVTQKYYYVSHDGLDLNDFNLYGYAFGTGESLYVDDVHLLIYCCL
jgi:hypothetical protein